MVEEKMSITRALAEIKRIQGTIDDMVKARGKYVGIAVGRGDKQKVSGSGNMTVEKAKEIINANVQKFNTLINRRSAIKRAIVLSNATTIVNFDGEQITVAEAIELRTQMAPLRAILADMVTEWGTAVKFIDDSNARVTAKIEQQVSESISAIPANSEMATAIEAIRKTITDTHLDNGEASLIDPCDVHSMIEARRNRLDKIETELDHILNESNAMTMIEFKY